VKNSNENHSDNAARYTVPAWGSGRQRLQVGAALLATCALVVAVPMIAQDVAEASRQEQTRKQKSARAKHVYSNDDLARHHILTPEDRRQTEAKRRQQSVPAGQPPSELDAQSTLQELPLGDVARKYRTQKEVLGQTPQSAEFHLPFGNTVLAAPRPAFAFVMPAPLPMHSRAISAPRPPALTNAAAPPAITVSSASRPAFAFVMPRPLPMHSRAMSVPEPPAFSKSAAPRTIIVRSGDTLWRLAKRNLGDGHRWHELAASNPKIVDPEHVIAGTPIRVAATTATIQDGSRFIVSKGDNLWKIAQAKLGFGAQWSCLAEANPSIVDVNRIYVGQVLALPAACPSKKRK
jgi:nucleoid-associated protein YgaU